MRFVILASVAALTTAVATFACSSAPPPAADDSNDTSTDPTTAAATPAATPAPVPAVVDTDAAAVLPVVTDNDAGLACTMSNGAPATPEVEPNNDATSAMTNVLAWPTNATNGFCGRLNPGDTDFFTFTNTSPGAYQWNMQQFGQVNITCTVAGQTFSVACGTNNCFVSQKNVPYVCQVTSTSPSTVVDWRVELQAVQAGGGFF